MRGFTLLAALVAGYGQTAAPPPFVAQLTEMLQRAHGGHSPTEDEIMAVESEAGLTEGSTASALLPLLQRALANPDAAVREYGLAMLVGVQSLPFPQVDTDKAIPKQNRTEPVDAATPRFQPEVGKALMPLIPLIGARLADERMQNRELAATDLGGFASAAPAIAYVPLLDFLKRDDAVSTVGLAAVGDLIAFGPLSPGTSAALTQYVQRPDQTAEVRAGLIQKFAASPNQSQQVNLSLLPLLDAEDAHLRATLLLALPLLDMPPESFARLRDRVRDLAAVGSQENPEVVAAARAVDACWGPGQDDEGLPGHVTILNASCCLHGSPFRHQRYPYLK